MADSAKKTNGRSECFVVMPITDPPEYSAGHFARVYQHLIKPACEAAGLQPVRADDVKGTNYIAIDILQRIVRSPLVVCDLSSRNPNVLYELGVRQAFDLPVVLIKDKGTDRIFDIQGLRTLDYDESLRIDAVQRDVETLKSIIESTKTPKPEDVNSLIKLLGVAKAEVKAHTDISAETALILSSLKDVSQRLAQFESKRAVPAIRTRPSAAGFERALPSGEPVEVGETVYVRGGDELGVFKGITQGGRIMLQGRDKTFLLPPDDPRYFELTTVPF